MATDTMNVSINGQSQVPPGFRFHPTEEELLLYYLCKKVASEKIDLDVIRDVDLNKLEPWEIQEKCKIGHSLQNDWYFFSHKDKKYPTGTRTNRATASGFWKATGRDKIIQSGSRRIGLRKTLVFYMGRAPHGQKSDWIMHEYRLDEHYSFSSNSIKGSDRLTGLAMNVGEDGWVVCRVFRKKNCVKTAIENPKMSHDLDSMYSDEHMFRSSNGEVMDDHVRLPRPESPTFDDQAIDDMFKESGSTSNSIDLGSNGCNYKQTRKVISPVQDWISFDRLVASHLDDQAAGSSEHIQFQNSTNFQEDEKQQSHVYAQMNVYKSEDDDIWSFIKSSASCPSSSDPLCRFFA